MQARRRRPMGRNIGFSNANSPSELARMLTDATELAPDELVECIKTADIERLGVIYDALSNAAFLKRVSPPLSREQIYGFLRTYYGRCLSEDPKGVWADSRYSAMWDAANWLKSSWRVLSEHEQREWREWIKTHYIDGAFAVREAIETGFLEHIFSDKKIADFFSVWEQEDLLRDAYLIAKKIARRM